MQTPTQPTTPIRVLIADDQSLIRRGMSLILAAESDIEVIGQAADGVEAVALALTLRPDVVLMDLHMPKKGGVIATREITTHLPNTRILVLTTFDTDSMVFDAVRAGAHAYLLKDTSEAEVLDTIRAVHRGESRLTPQIASKVMEQFRQMANQAPESITGPVVETPQPLTPDAIPATVQTGDAEWNHALLTDKEARVLELIAEGMSNKQIANTVFLAEGTVKNYVSRIMEKLHANTRTELAIMTLRNRAR